jgi:hypothetical protein
MYLGCEGVLEDTMAIGGGWRGPGQQGCGVGERWMRIEENF